MGGVLRDVSFDSGSLSWGAVGVPRPEDAFRAVSAALRLRAGFRDEGLGPVSVGVASGPVFTGVVGDEAARRALFLCLGRPVSSAFRLMLAAAGSVVVDAATCERVAEDFVVEAANFPFRGEEASSSSAKLKAPACFRVVSPRARASAFGTDAETVPASGSGGGRQNPTGKDADAESADRDDAIANASGALSREEAAGRLAATAASGESLVYGRREAKAQLVELLAAARCGEYLRGGAASGHTLLVEGGRGSGKSTFVAEAERLCEVIDLPFLSLQPDPKEMHPYEAVRLLLRGLMLPEGRSRLHSSATELEAAAVNAGAGAGHSRTQSVSEIAAEAMANADRRRRASTSAGISMEAWLQSAGEASVPPSPQGSNSAVAGPGGAGGAGPGLGSPRASTGSETRAVRILGRSPSSVGSPKSQGQQRGTGSPRTSTEIRLFPGRSASPGRGSPRHGLEARGGFFLSSLSPAAMAGRGLPGGDRDPRPVEFDTEDQLGDFERECGPSSQSDGRGIESWLEPPSCRSASAESPAGSSPRPAAGQPQSRRGPGPRLSSFGDGKLFIDALEFLKRVDMPLATGRNAQARESLLAKSAIAFVFALINFAAAYSGAGVPSPAGSERRASGDARAATAAGLVDFQMADSSEGHRVFSFLCRLLEGVARSSGALVIVDDFCDLDAASQKCLAFVAQTGRVCVLATSRKVPASTVSVEFNMLRQSRQTRRVELAPWSSLDDVAGFVSFVLRIEKENLSPVLARALAERTGGAPRPLRELVLFLVKTGFIELDNGRALASAALLRTGTAATGAGADTDPNSSRPSSRSHDQTRRHSAIGPRFEAGLAQYALNGAVDWGTIADCLKVLERHGVLACVQMPDGLFEYVFTEPAHVEVLRKTAGPSEAALVAWRAAEYLCRTSEHRGKADAAQVAGYYAAAGAASFAEPYWEIAAEAAVEAGRPAEALATLPAERAPPAAAVSLSPRGVYPPSTPPHAPARPAPPRAAQSPDAPCQAVQACFLQLGVKLQGRRPLALPVLLAALSSSRPPAPGPKLGALNAGARHMPNSLQAALQRATEAPPEQRRADILVAALGTYVSILAHCGDAASAAESALAMVRLTRQWSPDAVRADALATAASALSRARFGRRATEALLAGAARAAAALPAGELSGPLAVAQVTSAALSGAFGAVDASARSLISRLRAVGKDPDAGEVALAHALSRLLRGQTGPARALYKSLVFWARLGRATAALLEQSAAGQPAVAASPPAPCTFSDESGRGTGRVADLIDQALPAAPHPVEGFPLEALALSAADAACALREGRLPAAEEAALAAAEALQRHRPAGGGFGPAAASRATALHLALLPLLLAGETLANLLERGYTEQIAEISFRRSSSRRRLLHGGPLLASFADRSRPPVRDYGETEAGWRRHLRAALRDLVDGRWQALSGSRGAALRLYRRAAGLARDAGARLLENMAGARILQSTGSAILI
eukprot:tig00020801_g13905.t1